MTWRHYTTLFVIGLIIPFIIASFQELPGYMDADYYFAGGIQLAEGKGFNEPYIWNYLSNPQAIPNPSHTYWMPLASIISAIGMWIAGATTYTAGRAPFILLSACVPVLTALLSFNVSKQPRLAIASGLLAIFSMYYAPFMPVPDNYGIYMILGATFLVLAPRTERWVPFALGALAGLLALARSDGILWLGLAGLVILLKALSTTTQYEARSIFTHLISSGIITIIGYLTIMGFWHYRSLTLFDSFMTPGGGRLLWLENYNQTFIYPPDLLTREGFLEAGWSAAWGDRSLAFSANFNNAFAAQGEIFLFPLILIGLWSLRKDLRMKVAVTGWLILFVVMTFIFPFAGARGSFFHAGAAFQPMWWVAAPLGLESVLGWVRKRGLFTDANAPVFFQGSLVLLAVLMTFYLVNIRVVAGGWAKDDVIYPSVEKIFQDNGISPMDVVIVRNPPGYYLSSGRPAVVLPFGDESTILAVAEKFNAKYLVLEEGGTFEAIQDLYEDPTGNSSFIFLGEVDGAKLYRIEAQR